MAWQLCLLVLEHLTRSSGFTDVGRFDLDWRVIWIVYSYSLPASLPLASVS